MEESPPELKTALLLLPPLLLMLTGLARSSITPSFGSGIKVSLACHHWTCRLSAPCPREQQNPFSRLQALGYEPYFRTTKRAEQRSASRSYVPFQAPTEGTGTRTVYLYIPKSAVSWSALRRRPCLRPAHRSHRAQPKPVTSVRSLAREKSDQVSVSSGALKKTMEPPRTPPLP